MTDIYEKSLKLMDEFLDSLSDEEFLEEYLSVEEFQGPLVKDFLMEYSISNEGYTDLLNLEVFNLRKPDIHTIRNISSIKF